MCALKEILAREYAFDSRSFGSVRCFASCGGRLPAQNWFARGANFVEAADARGVRRVLHNFRLRGGFLGDGFHRIDEEVALFLGLGFRRLDHHRPRHNQRKRRGVRMKTVVDRSEEHTSELQSRQYLVCRLLLEKKKK